MPFSRLQNPKLIFSSASVDRKMCISLRSSLLSITTINIMTNNNLINCLPLCTCNVSWSQKEAEEFKTQSDMMLIRGPEGSKGKAEYQAPATPLFSTAHSPLILDNRHTRWPVTTTCPSFNAGSSIPAAYTFGFTVLFCPLSSEFCFSNRSIHIALILGYSEVFITRYGPFN